MAAQVKVLCVDDDRDTAQATRRSLELAGCDVRVCHDGPAALSEAEEFYPDVYVIDLTVPDMGGEGLAVRLREQAGERLVRFIALTDLWGITARHQTHNVGFEEHLVTPVDPARLVGAVTGLISGVGGRGNVGTSSRPETGPSGGRASAVASTAEEAWDSNRQGVQRAASAVADTAGDTWGEVTGLMRRYPCGTLFVGIGLGFALSRLLEGRGTRDFRRLGSELYDRVRDYASDVASRPRT